MPLRLSYEEDVSDLNETLAALAGGVASNPD